MADLMTPDCVLEEWKAQGIPHRLRFTGDDLVVEHLMAYRDIGSVWVGCYLGRFLIPNINEQPDEAREVPNG